MNVVCCGGMYIKMETIQRRSAQPFFKDDMQIHEVFCVFLLKKNIIGYIIF